MAESGASDLYLTIGSVPSLRTPDGFSSIDTAPLTPVQLNEIVSSILTARQRHEFDKHLEYNMALDGGDFGRFRVNLLKQRQNTALVIRRIVSKIPSFEALHLPPLYGQLALQKMGLVLVVGMTGVGKSTSLAAMVNYRNAQKQGHIITIEDPIEYYHEHQKSIITQREVGVDTKSYASALKNALRQRPDAILIGEIRDREVMEQALTISETGHLCLATIHANNAHQAIDRIVNFFPDDLSAQIRMTLAMNLKAVLSQRLIPTVSGGLTPALEVLLNEGLIRELIQKGESPKSAWRLKKIRQLACRVSINRF